jgi:SSS family solute:Na+ symporter
MIGIGCFASRRTRSQADFFLAGRSLGGVLYAGTMGAVVMGGGSTIGGVGLGYAYGISGIWLVASLAIGLLLISLLLAPVISRLKVYTVAQMLELRYGAGVGLISGLVVVAYTFMNSVTSTIAYGSIFGVLFHVGKIPAILLGGGIVVFYAVLGGMWSISLTDIVQFLVKTIGFFLILLPAALTQAGGLGGLQAHLPETAFSFTHIGYDNILAYLLLYVLSMIVGQDIWQRICTARSVKVAKWGGVVASAYCFCYAFAGALIGMSAKLLLPDIPDRDRVFSEVVRYTLPSGVAGFVMAGALAAIMSASSGALIATATVLKQDLVRALRRRPAGDVNAQDERGLTSSRWYLLGSGLLMIAVACSIGDVVAGLTIACAILVAGLFIPVVGGIVWKRATLKGALASMFSGILITFGSMAFIGDIYASSPVYFGVAGGLVTFLVVSLLDKPSPAAVMTRWTERSARDVEQRSEADYALSEVDA